MCCICLAVYDSRKLFTNIRNKYYGCSISYDHLVFQIENIVVSSVLCNFWLVGMIRFD